MIGDNIEVVIVRIGPNAVRIGVEAPRDVTVIRAELKPGWTPILEDEEPQHA